MQQIVEKKRISINAHKPSVCCDGNPSSSFWSDIINIVTLMVIFLCIFSFPFFPLLYIPSFYFWIFLFYIFVLFFAMRSVVVKSWSLCYSVFRIDNLFYLYRSESSYLYKKKKNEKFLLFPVCAINFRFIFCSLQFTRCCSLSFLYDLLHRRRNA